MTDLRRAARAATAVYRRAGSPGRAGGGERPERAPAGAVLLPQIVLCGLFAPRDQMARPLEAVSDLLPMTYAFDGLHRVSTSSSMSGDLLLDIAVVVGSTVVALALAAATLRRRTA